MDDDDEGITEEDVEPPRWHFMVVEEGEGDLEGTLRGRVDNGRVALGEDVVVVVLFKVGW